MFFCTQAVGSALKCATWNLWGGPVWLLPPPQLQRAARPVCTVMLPEGGPRVAAAQRLRTA